MPNKQTQILQVHGWRCLVVQVMFHAMVTSSMTSPGHKVGQILKKLLYLHHYLACIFNFRYPVKNCRDLKMTGILKFWDIKHSFNLTSDIKRSSQIIIFHGDDVIVDDTGWPESCPLYSCLGEDGSGRKLQGQCLDNKCEYRNRLSRRYMSKEDLTK